MKKVLSLVLCFAVLVMSFGISVYAQSEKPFYLVLGDSIAYGSGLKNPKDACYGKIVSDTNGYEYANHSVPGHTTTNLIARLSNEEVIADLKKADIISISIGGNDFLLSNLIELMFDSMVKGDYSQFDMIAENFYANFSKIVDIINEHNEDALILMQTLYNPQSGYIREPYQQAADRLNAAIVRYSENNPGEIEIVDVGTALGDDLKNFADDAIHPSVAGNEIIAAKVLEKLAELDWGESTQSVIVTKGEDIRISKIFTSFLDFYGTLFHCISVIYNFFLNIFS